MQFGEFGSRGQWVLPGLAVLQITVRSRY
ncbi:hypothetical protein BN9982_1130008 [Mycobacterium tuberculosis]|nr:hypothetical protein BN9982_1130008 [Mycobacterium tuberculosis]